MIVIANVFLKLQTVKDLVKSLSNKRRFRTFYGSQLVKRSQTVAKSLWKIVYHISLITLRGNDLENISLMEIWNLTGIF